MTSQGHASVYEAQGGVALPPTAVPEKIQAKLDLSIALSLASWSALTLAVRNSWGGPESADKRDWFAGAISDLLKESPDADVDYLEEFMLHVMNDEFEVNIEDSSAEEVAAMIIGLRKQTLKGDFAKLDQMYQAWQARLQRQGSQAPGIIQGQQEDEDEEWNGFSSDEPEDVEMGEAPALVQGPKEKITPKVDDEGFTEVVSRRKR